MLTVCICRMGIVFTAKCLLRHISCVCTTLYWQMIQILKTIVVFNSQKLFSLMRYWSWHFLLRFFVTTMEEMIFPKSHRKIIYFLYHFILYTVGWRIKIFAWENLCDVYLTYWESTLRVFSTFGEYTPEILVFLAYIPKNVNLKVNLRLSQPVFNQNREIQIWFPR